VRDFDTSNDLAAQLGWGRPYQTNEPCPKVEKIVFTRSDSRFENGFVISNDATDWAEIASRIHTLLDHGFDYTLLPCRICGATEIDDVPHCHLRRSDPPWPGASLRDRR
jgi:hypothetical protein